MNPAPAPARMANLLHDHGPQRVDLCIAALAPRMHRRRLAQQAVDLQLQAAVLHLPLLHLGARLFRVQISGHRLAEVLLNRMLDRSVVLVGIQEPERVAARAHVAAIRELQQIVLQRLRQSVWVRERRRRGGGSRVTCLRCSTTP